MIIGAADQVAELRSLDSPPFAIGFRRAMCTVPPLGEAQNASHFSDVIVEVENLERFISSKQPLVPAPPILLSARNQKLVDELDRHVSFDAAVQGLSIDIFAASLGSVITIGSSLEPDYDVDTSVCDNPSNNIPLSA